MTDTFMTAIFKNNFVQRLLAMNSDIDPAQADKLWQDIAKHYSETIRAYHNLSHLKQLFNEFEQIESKLQRPNIIALALFYHDVIYDPTKQDNELKSAEYAVKNLQDQLSIEQCKRIYSLIMLTANHKLEDTADVDAAYLLDMDLSILGADWPAYKRYAQAVRVEYSQVALADYRAGRTAVLQQLLARPRLYLTDYYFERLENQAQNNIQREIILLRA